MNVVDLDERRAPAPDYAVCECGSSWFELRHPGAGEQPGQVCLNNDGSVTGYAGAPHCTECGKIWAPPAGGRRAKR